jgi:valyl-tRNA synthetase
MENFMSLPKRYKANEVEYRLITAWGESGVYQYTSDSNAPVFAIDTPPATVSGRLHLGHVYSYTHPDLIARFWRMRGRNVFYPMGYDDNGLPTERLVESQLGITASQVGRQTFIESCLEVGESAEAEYQQLWERLGLSIDWRFSYRTIDEHARRISQRSFIDLYNKGLAYRRKAPSIWCPQCATAIAQAELEDLERASNYYILDFRLENGCSLPIATTRPELLPACVAIFVHPSDERYRDLPGGTAIVPIFGASVPILEDPLVDQGKGTGVVMCCTFGDATDVIWWRTHNLPLIEALDRHGHMTALAGDFAGQALDTARAQIVQSLDEAGMILDRKPTTQFLHIHERCQTAVEYIVSKQWFVRLLDFKDDLLAAGAEVNWHPPHMESRYRAWVENLNWDWCISRQRYFGVPLPLWYCQACGGIITAGSDQLPVDPLAEEPDHPCPHCGSTEFQPEEDVMDTWATSSMTPQIVGRWLNSAEDRSSRPLYEQVFPFSLRPQAHEIIRTWAFYSIAKSHYHFRALPWSDVLISGWGIAGEGMGKISKSRGGGPLPPLEMIDRFSADAVRYWASSTSPGKDAIISEEKIKMGEKLVTKLWNIARFTERFIADIHDVDHQHLEHLLLDMTPADRWILSRQQGLIRQATTALEGYDYAIAKSLIESFFWRELADNYLEMCKVRLYDPESHQRTGGQFTLYYLLLTTIKLLAPYLPFVTEEIYQGLFAVRQGSHSIHASAWPTANPMLEDPKAEELGEILIAIATAVRRYKSQHNLSLGRKINRLQLASDDDMLLNSLREAEIDLVSVTRASKVVCVSKLDNDLIPLPLDGRLQVAIIDI